MNRLIMPIGLPRSGKSSWTRKQECPIVCVDCIRLALHGQPYLASAEPTVWSTAKLMVSSLFLAGHDRIILDDAINVRAADREGWRSEHWVREYVLFDTSKEVCIERAVRNDQWRLLPIIEWMSTQFEMPEEYIRPT